MTLKARVENGKIIADAPADYPEGTELEVETPTEKTPAVVVQKPFIDPKKEIL